MKTDKQALPVQGNILVVDDSRADLRLLVGILAERGHIVRPILDGASALTGAQAEPPDMILLDVNMPHMDGYEVCQRLKSDDHTGDIPVIFISASDQIFDKVKAFSIGGVDYITKPFQTEEVLARIETHLTLHSIEQRLKTQNSALQQEIAERKRVEAELQQHRDHLEKLVAARTADLQVANRQLQREIAERKQAEETLRESEERLRLALEGTTDGIWDWNPTTGQAYFSRRYYTMLGYEPGEFPPTYESWQQLLHPDDREAAEKNVHHAVEEHIPFAVEFRLKAKNGEWRWILGRGKVAEVDMEGRAVRVAGSHTDITERKRAEESMTKFFEQSLVMLYIADMEKNVLLRVNNEVVRITGRTEEELLSKPFLEFIHPEDREASMKALAVLAEGKPIIGFRNRHLTADGDCRIFEWMGTPDTERKLIYAMARDVTEQIAAEEALRIEKESLDKLFEGPVVAVFLIDENRKIKRINSTFTKLFGYTPEEAIGQDIVDLIFLEDDELEMLTKRAIKGERIEFETRRRRKDGTLVDVLISYAPVFIDDRYLGTYVTMRDITQRKRAEEALEKRIVALTQPLDTAEGIAFEDLFNLPEIQHLQDLYAEAFGVAALITLPDGTPITQPSNFSELCGEIIRKTPKGVENCNYSDAMVGRHNPSGPNVQPCLSAGLCNAGASITVGGRHVANWLIGQVRNETQNEEEIMEYAREIGADETAFRAAYHKVPTMSQEQFERVAQVLFAVADQLSTSAYQNVQQARFIAERKRAEEELTRYRQHLEELVDQRTTELNARVAEAEQLNQAMSNLLEDLQTANRNAEATSARLKEVNQELADFAYVVSHDLKAPLRGISQLAGWLSEDYTPVIDAQGQQWLSLLIGRTRRMHNLIEGILQYSRIGRVKEKERDVDLNHLVEDVIALLAPPQHIQVSVVGELPTVVGEPARLAQVFQNLLSNAVKFMDKPQGRIEISCVDEGMHRRFSVADNGPGMAAQYHDKIFQMFQTLAPRDEMENTGIGLALVKKIVETWGGRVWLESAEGQGSTFYFTLPK